MLTDAQIEKAKKEVAARDPHYEHNDCVRIAYEWLDAQKKLKHPRRSSRPLKHIIEKWGGRYVSRSDVEIAAHIHNEIIGEYPNFNISARLVEPSAERLKGIGEALSHGPSRWYSDTTYKDKE